LLREPPLHAGIVLPMNAGCWPEQPMRTFSSGLLIATTSRKGLRASRVSFDHTQTFPPRSVSFTFLLFFASANSGHAYNSFQVIATWASIIWSAGSGWPALKNGVAAVTRSPQMLTNTTFRRILLESRFNNAPVSDDSTFLKSGLVLSLIA